MNASPPSNTQPDVDGEKLLQSIEQALMRLGRNGSAVVALHRRRFPGSTSYAVEILTVEFATGGSIDLFRKDYGRSRLPKDAAADRRERELCVYEELLDGRELGTARLYAAHRDDAAARAWLLLEFVDGRLLRDCDYEHWPAAAAWLGRLHGHFRGQTERLRSCGFLARHDAAFFVDAAERAFRAVAAHSAALGERLATVLEDYDAVVAILAGDAETLVHGSYRTQNVLVDSSREPARICPTDWELAAFGRATYDLAFLCDGFRPPRLDELLDAYEREAESFGLPSPDRDELRYEIDCFRLHKTINSLGHLRQWPHPAETAAKVIATAEEIASVLR